MTYPPRPCTQPGDLEKMKHILIEGRRASPHSGYIHPGDLDWWVFYLLRSYSLAEIAYLGEEPGSSVIGWSLLTPDANTFDLFVHPAERGSSRMERLLCWTENRLLALRQNKKPVRTSWVFEDDTAWIDLLEKQGFTRDADYLMYYLVHPLNSIPEPLIPEGFILRHTIGDQDLEARAAVHRAAFDSTRMSPEAYQHFQQAPGYRPELDVIAAAPNGHLAAFAMSWLDTDNRIGEFEPVGTHPDFRKQGLGKATLLEGLRRMKACGAESAVVYVEKDNLAAQALYTSAGFRLTNRIYSYHKMV